MEIFVCIKMARDENGKPAMGAPDSYALEEALRIKDAHGARITVFCLGSSEAGPVLTRALAMGADEARHLVFEGPVPSGLAAALALKSAMENEALNGPFDLIFCGAASEDNGSGRTGPMLAGLFDLPLAGCVVDLAPVAESAVKVTREIESGKRLVLEMALPAVLTIQTSTRQPRYPSLSKLLKANKTEIPRLDFSVPPGFEAPEILVSEAPPCAVSRVVMLNGTTQEKAARLLRIFRDRGLV